MRRAGLIVGAVERTERERILISGEEVRLDGRLSVEALAEPRVARLMIGGKAGTCDRIVGENDSLREMPRRNRRNCFTGLRLGRKPRCGR